MRETEAFIQYIKVITNFVLYENNVYDVADFQSIYKFGINIKMCKIQQVIHYIDKFLCNSLVEKKYGNVVDLYIFLYTESKKLCYMYHFDVNVNYYLLCQNFEDTRAVKENLVEIYHTIKDTKLYHFNLNWMYVASCKLEDFNCKLTQMIKVFENTLHFSDFKFIPINGLKPEFVLFLNENVYKKK
ncbi:hypothetical protein A3Q56_00665 [Intoshia linei]|uniref:HORMA domain-containing protein n=1 Tax=Intoshia linei TaxID=1819745 RepID=A0A177BBC7_9BILA|nr:hypothetical protein A3Q56_00665 [Intoshia linei]